MTRVFLSLGSNVDAEDNLRLAVRELRQRLGDLLISPTYRNKAVGFEGDDFLNLVVAVDTPFDLERISAEIDAVHELAGRQQGGERFSARPLDIDILLFGDRVSSCPALTLPRPDVLRYSFVLKPLADMAPEQCHPQTGLSFATHWRQMDQHAHALQPIELLFD